MTPSGSTMLRFGGLVAISWLSIACGPELERVSELDNLRVLGVQKDFPYARPGEDVTLSMYWDDGSEEAPRDVETFWASGCTNPPGDLYSGCFSPSSFEAGGFDVAFNTDRYTVTIPDDILRPSQVPNLPPYGLSYVFFGACAGNLAPGSGVGLPVCLDDDGNNLGANDFVVGYSAIYAYENFRNENPIITAFRVGGRDVEVDCIGQDCVGNPFAVPDLDGCQAGVACIQACEDDGEPSCPEVDIAPVVSRESAEVDTIAAEEVGRDVEESIWVSYFVDRGSLKTDLRLVNDGAAGWIDDYAGDFYAPKETGPLRIWAVVRDNRGGVQWIRVRAFVE